jgi:NAD-dependent deacetylase
LPEAALQRAFAVSGKCDVMLVVGTSGVVYPAAALPSIARQGGGVVIEVNPEPGGITPIANTFLRGPGGRILPGLVEALKAAS